MISENPDNVSLADELRAMGVRQFTRWLATPSRSGFFFNSADIQRLGAQIGIRVAPFNRTTSIEQLLRGAALDDCLDRALTILATEMTAQLAAYREQDITELDPWIRRAESTLSAWEHISAAFLNEGREAG